MSQIGYSPSQRTQLLQKIRHRQKQSGSPIHLLVQEVGISPATYYKWAREERTAPAYELPMMRSVEVIAENHSAVGLTIWSPRGYHLAGLTLSEAAQLLQLVG